jgi:hypothetical protein
VHVQTPRGFRDVTTAQFIDALDVFPADAVRRHRILWRFSFATVRHKQGAANVIGIYWLGEIVDRA